MVQVYVFLGARASGRREVIADLIRFGLNPQEDRALVFLPQEEPEQEIDSQIDALEHAQTVRWNPASEAVVDVDELPAATHAFFVVDGAEDPVDQLERLRDWLQEHPEWELGRVITVLHSRLLYERKELIPWFDACIHFSDVVLMNRREDVPNKWFSDFEGRFKKECYPALFDIVKKGRVRNPAEILYPEPRRLSQAFDEIYEQLSGEDLPDIEIVHEIVDEADAVSDTELDDDDEDEEIVEPYFERLVSGERVRRLPNIKKFHDPEA